VARRLAEIETERLRDECERLRRKQRNGGGGSGHAADPSVYLLENQGPLRTLTGTQLAAMFHWSFEDVLELIGWGLPVVEVGSRRSLNGWRFAGVYVFRWLGLVGIAFRLIRDPGGTPAELRALRGLRPLSIPTGFRPFGPTAGGGDEAEAEEAAF
jgi:hypothetical protein